MIKTRGRKILKDVWSRKGRTLLVSLSIMIGVFGAVALISTNDLIIKQIQSDIVPDEVAMVRVFVTVPSAGTNVLTDEGVDQALDLVRNARQQATVPLGLAGVTRIEGQVVVPVYWQDASASESRFEEAQLMAFSEPFGEIQLEAPRLHDGEWPLPGQHQLAVEQRMADENGLEVGDKIRFRSMGGADVAEDWTITGTLYHPYWVDTGEDNQPEIRIFANYSDAQQIANFSGFSSFYLRYSDLESGHNQADRLMETLAEDTVYIPQYYWLDDPDDYFLIGEVKEITNILNTLAIVALVVSGFLVTNVINTIVVEQKRQIGVMKSLGATRWTNFTIYAGIALIYGLLGTIPGVILGIVAGAAMAQALAPLASTLIDGFKISSVGIIAGAVMGLAVPVIAALLPVFNGTRVSVLDAMTDLGISTTWGSGLFARIIAKLPLPANIRQALSNVMQKKGRLLLTVITLTLAAAAFMGVFAMFTVITDEINKLFDTFEYEITILPTEAQDFESTRQMIMDTGAAGDVYPGVAFGIRFLDVNGAAILVGPEQEDTVMAFGYDPATPMMNFTYTEGAGWSEDPTLPGVVLTSSAAKDMGKKVGDTLIISAGGHTTERELIGIAQYPFPFAFMQWQDLAQLAGFVNNNGTPDNVEDDTALPIAMFATTAESDPSSDDVNVSIDKISETLLDAGITASLSNLVEEQEAIADQMMVFNLIFQMTSAVMAAVGAIGLLTTLSMAVFERQKEIGVMRSIGAGSGTIVTQFLVEGILIGLLAWALAIPLSYLLAVSLLDGMGMSDFISFHYPLWVLGMGLAGMMVVAILASLWPSLSAARKTVSDILRYQ